MANDVVSGISKNTVVTFGAVTIDEFRYEMAGIRRRQARELHRMRLRWRRLNRPSTLRWHIGLRLWRQRQARWRREDGLDAIARPHDEERSSCATFETLVDVVDRRHDLEVVDSPHLTHAPPLPAAEPLPVGSRAA